MGPGSLWAGTGPNYPLAIDAIALVQPRSAWSWRQPRPPNLLVHFPHHHLPCTDRITSFWRQTHLPPTQTLRKQQQTSFVDVCNRLIHTMSSPFSSVPFSGLWYTKHSTSHWAFFATQTNSVPFPLHSPHPNSSSSSSSSFFLFWVWLLYSLVSFCYPATWISCTYT